MLEDKSILILGIGNAGCQVANLAEKRYPILFDTIYINSSDADLAMVQGAIKFKIGEKIEGTGKNRLKMKQYLKDDIKNILNNQTFGETMSGKKYVFVVASTAGGTGSGSAPVMMEVLRTCFPNKKYVLVGILPQLQASLMEQGNTIEFLNELYEELGSDTTYMIYDNETSSVGYSPTEGLEIVNDAIVEDIRVLSGIDNYPTPYDSIDEADLQSIISTPGRLLVVRIKKGLTEKVFEDNQIDDMIIKSIKQSHHTETDRNRKVVRWGIITYFTESVNRLYMASLEKLNSFLGTPVERFNHHAINDKPEAHNFFYLISSGLSPINDRIKRINERIESLKQALAEAASTKSILNGEDLVYDISADRRKEEKVLNDTPVNPLDIFNRFM